MLPKSVLVLVEPAIGRYVDAAQFTTLLGRRDCAGVSRSIWITRVAGRHVMGRFVFICEMLEDAWHQLPQPPAGPIGLGRPPNAWAQGPRGKPASCSIPLADMTAKKEVAR